MGGLGLGLGQGSGARTRIYIYSASWCWETVPWYSYKGRKRNAALEERFGEDREVVHSSLLTYCTSITELDNASQPNQIISRLIDRLQFCSLYRIKRNVILRKVGTQTRGFFFRGTLNCH
jgi:hypothetical protein